MDSVAFVKPRSEMVHPETRLSSKVLASQAPVKVEMGPVVQAALARWIRRERTSEVWNWRGMVVSSCG